MIRLTVTGGGFVTTVAEFVRTVNFLPYGGLCSLGTTNAVVVSARDWLILTCENWQGNDERKTKGTDNNPLLNFVVRQTTVGSLVPTEPILSTSATRSHVILKVGAPPTFGTTLTVEVTDLHNNFAVVEIAVTANPVFNYSAVTPNTAGADLIKAYTEVKYPFDEAQLLNMGKSDLIISLISAVCSNLHLVEGRLPASGPGSALTARQGRLPASGPGSALTARQGRLPASGPGSALTARQGRLPASGPGSALTARQGRLPASGPGSALTARQEKARHN
ncbi:uncharacterized protein LOC128246225 [Mya arenaria]|uniref:uncharacterized protein LOC128246225 n=1 Tax=Mya arenaria TaxID=6604 RepID=UPI0022DF2736|nr:uncharacterized protein LOC128246225 [Mya arenaria]